MKRYWLFCGENYYPSGGMRDFRDSFDTVLECVKNLRPRSDWWHIYDTATNQTIEHYETKSMGANLIIEWAKQKDLNASNVS